MHARVVYAGRSVTCATWHHDWRVPYDGVVPCWAKLFGCPSYGSYSFDDSESMLLLCCPLERIVCSVHAGAAGVDMWHISRASCI